MTLAEYVTLNLDKKFKWGEHDCVLFVAGWITIKTETDVLGDVPRWTSIRAAKRIVASLGGLENILDKRCIRINKNLACDGDIALYNDSLCLYSGAYIVGAGIEGLEFINRGEATCAWRY